MPYIQTRRDVIGEGSARDKNGILNGIKTDFIFK